MPDVANSKKTVIALASGHVSNAVVLPRWEGQAWWGTLLDNVSSMIELEDMKKVVAPNMYGLEGKGAAVLSPDSADELEMLILLLRLLEGSPFVSLT